MRKFLLPGGGVASYTMGSLLPFAAVCMDAHFGPITLELFVPTEVGLHLEELHLELPAF
jgi:hypothetical protein